MSYITMIYITIYIFFYSSSVHPFKMLCSIEIDNNNIIVLRCVS